MALKIRVLQAKEKLGKVQLKSPLGPLRLKVTRCFANPSKQHGMDQY
jgi:hypothetical protein